jgi:hypothetical protein
MRAFSLHRSGLRGTVASNAFWKFSSRWLTGLTGISVSILTARTRQQSDFPRPQLLIWLTTMVAMSTPTSPRRRLLRKYVPALVPQRRRNRGRLAVTCG